MQQQEWYAQDSEIGATGRTLEGITSLGDLPHFRQFRAAVAYATLGGCRILADRLGKSSRFRRAQKRWLISIDFGRTEPAALEFLSGLSNSEVRVPSGAAVMMRRGFAPILSFHPKTYVVDDQRGATSRVFGVFLGSGNLTSSGLLTGCEHGALSCWVDPTRVERGRMASASQHSEWFEDAWGRANLLKDVLATYKSRWRRWAPPAREEDAETTDLYLGGSDRVISGTIAINLREASGLWVEVGELYKNRGAGQAGNQVDLPRGSRVFFGFSSADVPRNTILGHIYLQNVGFRAVECSVRFGNNQMDKVNLPVPGMDGPPTYDNCILLFERQPRRIAGLPRFRIVMGNRTELAVWKMRAAAEVEYSMRGGRKWGLLFNK